jgi:hypothetical protein
LVRHCRQKSSGFRGYIGTGRNTTRYVTGFLCQKGVSKNPTTVISFVEKIENLGDTSAPSNGSKIEKIHFSFPTMTLLGVILCGNTLGMLFLRKNASIFRKSNFCILSFSKYVLSLEKNSKKWSVFLRKNNIANVFPA